MALTNDFIQEKLQQHFGEAVQQFETNFDVLSFTAEAGQNLKIAQFLYDEKDLGFQFLTDITGVHFPDRKNEELSVVYHFHNLLENVRLRMKIFVPIDKPDVFTFTQLYSGANWMERETYDFFGVNFVGHPNLKRILN